ncbi:MAG: DEAD/DEAH box helicase [Deltaproteobacteria bacterium]|nr:DEAD/DEAH box helicase [Deltaproteobacteria bacterium]
MTSEVISPLGQPTNTFADIPNFERLEFHRNGLALLPVSSEKSTGVSLLIFGANAGFDLRICDCTKNKKQTCQHILDLVEVYKAFKIRSNGLTPYDAFRGSLWYRLAAILGDGGRETLEDLQLQSSGSGENSYILVTNSKGLNLARYYSVGPDSATFHQRLGKISRDSKHDRAVLLNKLVLMTRTEQERVIHQKGLQLKTNRMLMENSVWYRMAYHCFHENGTADITLKPEIDLKTGEFTVAIRQDGGRIIIRLVIPRDKVRLFIKGIKEHLPNQEDFAIHPVPLKSIFKISRATELDLEVRPVIQMLQEKGETAFIQGVDFERFRYGDLIYLKDLGIMAELEKSTGRERRFQAPVRMLLKRSQVPIFLEEHAEDINENKIIISPEIKSFRILKKFDRLEIISKAIDRNWLWLDVRYGFGKASLSLAELIQARNDNQRYVYTSEGWVDTNADVFDILKSSFISGSTASGKQLKLSSLGFLQLTASSEAPVQVKGDSEKDNILKRIMELQPRTPEAFLPKEPADLRAYQVLGLKWLLFLFENRLGGLLCDEMGLGKTHQAMALMAGIRELGLADGPILVVCPTTVLSHWRDKIQKFAPSLKPALYHGPHRDLKAVLPAHDILLTSYGLLYNDQDLLKEIDWSLAVFDEIHSLKNPLTQTHEAAKSIRSGIKIGLTGTPIENRLQDLKALFDLVLPGYLGGDQSFKDRYGASAGDYVSTKGREELRRLVTPFILRRTKATVLTELPEKIEDLRSCTLSDDQIKLYRDAVENRGRKLIDTIRSGKEPVPYIHIFALLNLLKRICNHPALITREIEQYDDYQSGKWELFKEIIQESLDSGEKVVVFSQFLDMIKIMENYLRSIDVSFVTLTGQSRDRGQIVAKFDADPACRVFLGSLKAGGVGIDLVAGSVVIHYDRWWNAAKENQATDRVHRIGQRRTVQVFKLLTEGTLEEKIAAIIERKKAILNDIIQEDDPSIIKSCSPEELIGLLTL